MKHTIFTELRALQHALLPWIASVTATTAYAFAGPSKFLIQRIRRDLLPTDVALVSLSPADGFVSRVWVSLLLALVVTSPIFMFRLATFLAPALTPHERHVLAISVLPMLGLFVAGSIVAYVFIVPLTLRFLYDLTRDLNVGQLVSLPSFVGFVVGIMAVVGILFELPVAIVGATAAGLVPAVFWSRYRRHAIIVFLILTAFITPDGTGVTMLVLALPLIGLYALGTFFAKRFSLKKEVNHG